MTNGPRNSCVSFRPKPSVSSTRSFLLSCLGFILESSEQISAVGLYPSTGARETGLVVGDIVDSDAEGRLVCSSLTETIAGGGGVTISLFSTVSLLPSTTAALDPTSVTNIVCICVGTFVSVMSVGLEVIMSPRSVVGSCVLVSACGAGGLSDAAAIVTVGGFVAADTATGAVVVETNLCDVGTIVGGPVSCCISSSLVLSVSLLEAEFAKVTKTVPLVAFAVSATMTGVVDGIIVVSVLM